MDLLKILLLLFVQFGIGFGIISFFKLNFRPWMTIGLSILLGLGIISLVLLFPIFVRLSLTANAFYLTIAITLLLSNISSIKQKGRNYKKLFLDSGIFSKIKIYEIPAILLIIFLIFVSSWRCFYFPPTPRDLTSGPEAIAEFAVREHKIASSLFTVNFETTNNQFKSPYIIVLQMLYKFMGFPFGKVWLISILIGFYLFLYQALSRNIHAIFAGALLFWFILIPEMFSYTFMVLYDYSNAVFFSVGAFFLYEYIKEKENKAPLILSGIFFALATYIRTETLVLIPFVGLSYFVATLVWKKEKIGKVLTSVMIVFLPSVIIYFVTGSYYLNHYIPQHYDIDGLVNKNLGNLAPFFDRLSGIGELLEGKVFVNLYGNFLNLFILVLVIDIVLKFVLKSPADIEMKKNRVGYLWVTGAALLIIGISFLGYLLPLMDLENTTKRSLFKLFPFLLLYFGHSLVFRKLTLILK